MDLHALSGRNRESFLAQIKGSLCDYTHDQIYHDILVEILEQIVKESIRAIFLHAVSLRLKQRKMIADIKMTCMEYISFDRESFTENGEFASLEHIANNWLLYIPLHVFIIDLFTPSTRFKICYETFKHKINMTKPDLPKIKDFVTLEEDLLDNFPKLKNDREKHQELVIKIQHWGKLLCSQSEPFLNIRSSLFELQELLELNEESRKWQLFIATDLYEKFFASPKFKTLPEMYQKLWKAENEGLRNSINPKSSIDDREIIIDKELKRFMVDFSIIKAPTDSPPQKSQATLISPPKPRETKKEIAVEEKNHQLQITLEMEIYPKFNTLFQS
jgi:hypothetical protein